MKNLPTLKDLLSDRNKRIALHDFIVDRVDRFVAENPPARLKDSDRVRGADLQAVLASAHETFSDMVEIAVLLGSWADDAQVAEVEEFFSRLVAANMMEGGQLASGTLNWYPIYIFLHAIGVGAVRAKNFKAINAAITLPVRETYEGQTLLVFLLTKMVRFGDAFKTIPGHEDKKMPRSEHLFSSLRDLADPHLRLGTRFEGVFDELEVLFALTYVDMTGQEWGPPGRFAYKRSGIDDPLDRVLKNVESKGQMWEPLQAGFFGSSLEDFNKAKDAYLEKLSSSWW